MTQQIAAQRASGGGSENQATPDDGGGGARTVTIMGRSVPVPEEMNLEEAQALAQRMKGVDDMRSMMQSLSDSDRNIMRQLMGRGGQGGGGGDGSGQGRNETAADAALMGGTYTVFAIRDGFAVPVSVQTGLTDLDYSEVVSGLAVGDTVLVLPSSSLLASQQQMQERLSRMSGRMPGISRR